MKILIVFTICISIALSDMASDCNMAGFYTELGCEPVLKEGKCPEYFNCQNLRSDPSMCYYRGEAYANRASLPDSVILNPCSQACSCRVTDMPRFECASVDCVESFGPDENKECVQTYELNSCCSTDVVCGKDAIAQLKTCTVDGTTYYEGQTFEPKNTRKTCICTKDWDKCKDDVTSLNCSDCRDINCGLEIHYQDKLMNNCAPVFAINSLGCPIGFECPTATSKVARGLNIKNIDAQCTFGNQTLSVGDKVLVADENVACTCQVPPFVECTRSNL